MILKKTFKTNANVNQETLNELMLCIKLDEKWLISSFMLKISNIVLMQAKNCKKKTFKTNMYFIK
jgi:hypothetical protein